MNEDNPLNENDRKKAEIARMRQALDQHGTAFTDMSVTNQAAFYDARADVYDAQNSLPERIARRERVFDIYEETLRPLLSGRSLRYLDAGCGTGTATNEFLARLEEYATVDELMAIDISPAMAAIARDNMPEATVMAQAVTDPIPDKQFDLTTLFFHVLCHLNERELKDFFEQLGDQVSDGGIVCFDVIRQYDVDEHGYTEEDARLNRKYLVYYSSNPEGEPITDATGQPIIGTDRLFTEEEIRGLAEIAGLNVVSITEFDVPNPDPRIGSLREYAVVLQKTASNH